MSTAWAFSKQPKAFQRASVSCCKNLRPIAAMKAEPRRACLKIFADAKSPLDLRMELLEEFTWSSQLDGPAKKQAFDVLGRTFVDPANGLPDTELQGLDSVLQNLGNADWPKSQKRREVRITRILTPGPELPESELRQRCDFYRTRCHR